MKTEDVLKLYDNAIYLNDASEEEVKQLLKLGRALVEQTDYYKPMDVLSLYEPSEIIENFKEIRV